MKQNPVKPSRPVQVKLEDMFSDEPIAKPKQKRNRKSTGPTVTVHNPRKSIANPNLCINKASKANGRWTPRHNGSYPGSQTGISRNKVYTDEMIADALMRGKGLMYVTAKLLGMNGSHLGQRVNHSPFLLKVREEAMESRLDNAETKLEDIIDSPGPSQLGAVCFFLKCQGKKRGYVERQETQEVAASVDLEAMSDDQLSGLLEAIAKRLGTKA